MLKIFNGPEQIWVLKHACIITRPGYKARVKHLTSFSRRWRLNQAKLLGNKVESATALERKIVYIVFGTELRAAGGIK